MDERPVWIRGTNIWTGTGDTVSSMLLYQGHVLATGSDDFIREMDLARWAQSVSFTGKTVIPGMTDSHTLFSSFARQRMAVDTGMCLSKKELLEAIRKSATHIPPDRWLHCNRFNNVFWKDPTLPTRKDIDSLGIANPIFLTRACNRVRVANGAALMAAGIDPRQVPDGILRDIEADPLISAYDRWLTGPSIMNMLIEAGREMLSYGITEIHSVMTYSSTKNRFLSVVQDLRDNNKMRLRSIFYPEELAPWGIRSGFGNHYCRYGGMHLSLDGTIGNRTAAISFGYQGSENRGHLRYSDDEIISIAKECHRYGIQMYLSVSGDRALDQAILAIKAAHEAGPCRNGMPHRINHAFICRDDQIDALKSLGNGVSVTGQPAFMVSVGHVDENILGDRIKLCYRWKDMLSAGISVCAASAVPISKILSPFTGMWIGGREYSRFAMYGTNQQLSVMELLKMYTSEPAVAAGEKGSRGCLCKGASADFAVIDGDLFSMPLDKIKTLKASETWVQGQKSYSAKEN